MHVKIVFKFITVKSKLNVKHPRSLLDIIGCFPQLGVFGYLWMCLDVWSHDLILTSIYIREISNYIQDKIWNLESATSSVIYESSAIELIYCKNWKQKYLGSLVLTVSAYHTFIEYTIMTSHLLPMICQTCQRSEKL